jgi:hypothetical protein
MTQFARTNSKAPEPVTTLRSGAVFYDEQEMFLHAEAPSFYTISPERRHDHTNFFRGALLAVAINSPFWIAAIICAIRYFNHR